MPSSIELNFQHQIDLYGTARYLTGFNILRSLYLQHLPARSSTSAVSRIGWTRLSTAAKQEQKQLCHDTLGLDLESSCRIGYDTVRVSFSSGPSYLLFARRLDSMS